MSLFYKWRGSNRLQVNFISHLGELRTTRPKTNSAHVNWSHIKLGPRQHSPRLYDNSAQIHKTTLPTFFLKYMRLACSCMMQPAYLCISIHVHGCLYNQWRVQSGFRGFAQTPSIPPVFKYPMKMK